MQKFKETDLTEDKFINVLDPILGTLSSQKDLLYEGAFGAFPLGAAIYTTKRAPLTNAIKKEIFEEAFSEIFEAFIAGGSFETYLTVFRKIFGEGVEVEFTVPAPGKLIIDIEAEGVVLSDFAARRIVDNAYVNDEVIDDEGDNIALQTVKGFESQYELELMLFEMVAGGIFTQISLTIGV